MVIPAAFNFEIWEVWACRTPNHGPVGAAFGAATPVAAALVVDATLAAATVGTALVAGAAAGAGAGAIDEVGVATSADELDAADPAAEDVGEDVVDIPDTELAEVGAVVMAGSTGAFVGVAETPFFVGLATTRFFVGLVAALDDAGRDVAGRDFAEPLFKDRTRGATAPSAIGSVETGRGSAAIDWFEKIGFKAAASDMLAIPRTFAENGATNVTVAITDRAAIATTNASRNRGKCTAPLWGRAKRRRASASPALGPAWPGRRRCDGMLKPHWVAKWAIDKALN